MLTYLVPDTEDVYTDVCLVNERTLSWKSQNNWMVRAGKDVVHHLVQILYRRAWCPGLWKDGNWRFPRRRLWNLSKFQSPKEHRILSDVEQNLLLNRTSILCPFPLVLILGTTDNSCSPSSLHPPFNFYFCKHWWDSPLSLLFSKLECHSQPFLTG